jgi:hypothetical protein
MGNAAVVAEPAAVGEEPAVAPREEPLKKKWQSNIDSFLGDEPAAAAPWEEPQKKKRQSNISSFFAEKRVFERTE